MVIVRWAFSVDIARSAVNTAKHIIAQVNPNVPRTHGDGLIHSSRFDSMVYCEDPLYEVRFSDKITETELKIGHISPVSLRTVVHYKWDWFYS
jgi:hypothetical protein